MADGNRASSGPLVVQRSQQLQVAPPRWEPMGDQSQSREPIGGQGKHSTSPIGGTGLSEGPSEDQTVQADLWNRVGIYVVGTRYYSIQSIYQFHTTYVTVNDNLQ